MPESNVPPPPGGVLPRDSPFYIERGHETTLITTLGQERGFVVLKGARQTGKSTLIAATQSHFTKTGAVRVAKVDLQSLPKPSFQTANTLWFQVARRVATALGIVNWKPSDWDVADDDPYYNLQAFLKCVFPSETTRPLLICLDETDRTLQ